MEPLAHAGAQTIPMPDEQTPRTLVRRMAIHCLSPTANELPEDLAERARSIENEQRQLIACRKECTTQGLEHHHTKTVIDGSESSESPEAASPPQSRGPSTPPLSTVPTSNNGCASPPLKASSTTVTEPTRRPRSFGGRRSLRPRALDLNALRRERQFSGPYSANPLLPRKRAESDEEPAAISDGKSKRQQAKSLDCDPLEPTPFEPEPGEARKNIRLPLISEMTTAPFVASGSSRASDKLWLPLYTPSPRSAAAASLPTSASHVALLTPPSATVPMGHSYAGNNKTRDYRSDVDVGSQRSYSLTSSANQAPPQSGTERKERYMQLCSEMWDLMQG